MLVIDHTLSEALSTHYHTTPHHTATTYLLNSNLTSIMFGNRIGFLVAAASIALFATPALSQEVQCPSCPELSDRAHEFENLQQNLDNCLHSKSEIETATTNNNKDNANDLIALTDKLTALEQQYHTCKQDSVSIQSNYNEILQSESKLQTKITHQQTAHNQKEKTLREELSSLQTKLEQQKKHHKNLNERYLKAREESQEMEKELRRIRFESQRTYLNTTLIREDVGKTFVKYTDRGVALVEEAWRHDRVQQVKSVVMEKSAPLVEHGKGLYDKHGKGKVEEMVQKMKDIDQIEGVRLTVVSFVQHGSRAVLDYMELTGSVSKDKNKFGTKSHGCKCGKLKKMLVKSLKYAEKNPDLLVNRAVGGVMALLVWRVIVTLLHLVFYLISRIFGFGKKKKKKKNDGKKKTKAKQE